MKVAGKGKFLLAKNLGTSKRFYGSRGGGEDLVLPPYQSVVVDEKWADIPHFVRDADSGKISVWRSDDIPPLVNDVVDEVWGLDDTQKQTANILCKTPTLTPQLRSIIHLSNLIGDNGQPRPGVSITLDYLKTKHMPWLKAVLQLEKRMMNRDEVIAEVEQEINRIETI